LHCKKEHQGNRWKRRRDNRIHRLLRPVAFRTLQKMVHLEIQYFSFNRILLLVIGLWPYEQSKFTRFQFIFFSAILTSGIIFQVRTEYNNTQLCDKVPFCKSSLSHSFYYYIMSYYYLLLYNVFIIINVLLLYNVSVIWIYNHL